MGRKRGKKSNQTIPKVLGLVDALAGRVEAKVVQSVLAACNGDCDRALEALLSMLDPITDEESPTSLDTSQDAQAPASPAPVVDDEPRISLPADQIIVGRHRSWWPHYNSFCLRPSAEEGWSLFCELFEDLLTLDELARVYRRSNSSIVKAVECAFKVIEEDDGIESALVEQDSTAENAHTNDISAEEHLDLAVKKLTDVFPDHSREDIAAALIASNCNIETAATMLVSQDVGDLTPSFAVQVRSSSARTYADAVSKASRIGKVSSRNAHTGSQKRDFPRISFAAVNRSRTQGIEREAQTWSDGQERSRSEWYRPADSISDRPESTLAAKQRSPPPQNLRASHVMIEKSVSHREVIEGSNSEQSSRVHRKRQQWEARKWHVVETSRRKRAEPEPYIPGLHPPEYADRLRHSSTEVDTEYYWRNKADEARNNMMSCFRRAAQNHRKHGGGAAHELSIQGHKFRDEMQLCNARAAACILRNNNEALEVNTHGKTLSYSGAVAAEDDRQTGTYCRVDLHGLRVREALEFIYSIIERHRASQTQMTVEAITGIGRGSAGGQARLLPNITRMLKAEDIAHTVDGGKIRFRV